MRHGGVANRPGTEFVGEVKDSTKTVRLIPFVFNSSQTYVLEFGNLYLRVIRDGAQVTETAQNITAISNANPCVVTYAGADNYANGDEVYISGITGAIGTYLNGRNFKVANLNAGANTFSLTYMNGTAVNSTGFGAYSSGGTVAEVYTITTPYVEADLSTLSFAQSADVVTITHPNYAPRELTRSGHASWTLSTISFSPQIAGPEGGSSTVGVAGAGTIKYRVTAVDDDTSEESLPGYGPTQAITNITQANPAVVTYTGADNFQNGDEIIIRSVVGMTEVNNLKFTVANLNAGANTFELLGINSTSYTAYSSGGTVAKTYIRIDSAGTPTSAAPNVITWTAVANAREYTVYKEENGVYGYIGIAGSTTFNDIGYNADTTDTPPADSTVFEATGDYPSTVTYYQQRRIFANSDNDPEKVWASRSGKFNNFTASSPIQDDDTIAFTLSGSEVNEVRHLLSLGSLVILTSGGEHAAAGDSSGVLTPTAVNQKQYSYNGSSTLRPLIVNSSALYVQDTGSVVRDLAFSLNADGYTGDDLTIFSAHLVDDNTIVDWAYQKIPHSIVWMVRDDGTLLGLTYIKEQQMVGWHRHDFDGTVENVCAVPEGTETALYLTIKRTINSSTKRYIERLSTRKISDIVDAKFMDCALSYDGRNTNASHTMDLSEYSGGGWLYSSTITITSSASYFTSADVGNSIFLYDLDADGNVEDMVRVELTSYVSGTVMRGRPHKTVPAALQTATADWSRAVDEVTGLWHLEGQSVAVLGDGFVVASPNNEAYTTRTVTNGTLTLDKAYAVIHAGIPYLSDIQTLDVDVAQGETMADKKKRVSRVTLHVEKSRGIWAGPKPPSDDDADPLENLVEFKIRDDESMDEPVELTTGTVTMNIKPEWNSNGRVFIRQVDPLPLTVLAIAPDGSFPFRG